MEWEGLVKTSKARPRDTHTGCEGRRLRLSEVEKGEGWEGGKDE